MKTKSLFIATAIALMTCAASAQPDLNSVSERLVKSMPGLTVDSISESAIPGLYEVVSGGEVAYVTSDGGHMIQGTLFNVPERKNLSEKALSAQRAKALGTIEKSSLVTYKAKGKEKHTITVFTDPSCPFCVRLHGEIPKLNEMGVTVRYALYARSGNGTLTSRQLSEVICSVDKKAAVDRFFAAPSSNSTGAECKQADGLERIAKVAQQVGLKGTPHIVTDKGFASSGYMSAPELLRTLQGS